MRRRIDIALPWWALIVFPLLAGVGIADLMEDYVPEAWQPWLILGVALAAIPWSIREARWAKGMQRKIEADVAELQRIAEGRE